MDNEHIILSHYRIFQERTAGVESVMFSQRELLRRFNRRVSFLVGESDLQEGSIINPAIRMKRTGIWTKGEDTTVDNTEVTAMTKQINGQTQDGTILFHNTTNAAIYNPAFGIAAATIVDQSMRGERPLAVLFAHDADASPAQLQLLLPTEENARIAVISDVRRRQIQAKIASARDNGLQLPEYDMRVIPNTIDYRYFEPEVLIPETLTALAPHFDQLHKDYRLPNNYEKAEKILFSPDADYVKFLLLGRIAHNKGVSEAIQTAKAYADTYNQQVALIISNYPEADTQANRDYWEKIQKMYFELQGSNVEIILLGGVHRDYMKWLYKASTLLVAPFRNEGFGLPPIEAACCDLASVISTDPALQETTGENGLVLDYAIWDNPEEAASRIHTYLSSENTTLHPRRLKAKAALQYSPQVVGEQILALVDPRA